MDVDSDDSEDIQIEKYLTGSKIYRDLWAEFYTWEQVFCQQTLEGLSKPPVGVRPRSPSHGTSICDLPTVFSSSEEEDSFTFEDISLDSTVTLKFTLSPNPKIVETRNWDAIATYTACTPISTNTILKEDPTCLHFAPYADDPLFNLNKYLARPEIGWFDWQYDLHDPDRKYILSPFHCSAKQTLPFFYVPFLLKLVEMIQLEAVRRLRHGSGFDEDEINSLGIFPSLRDSNRSGLIWYSSQRYEHILFPFHHLDSHDFIFLFLLLATFSGGQDHKYQV
jgi:histone-lysine N-methyltransferase EZH2